MSKNRKISSLEFDYIVKTEPYLSKNDKNGLKALKYTMLDQIEGVFGDKWFNLSDKTRQAIDYICFLALDRGFVFASPGHIAEEHGIGESTVYKALKVLREEDLLVKANRCSKKQNGLGCAVHFFTIHPRFEQINSFLNLGWKAKEKADEKAQIAEMPHETKEVSDFDSSTYSLSSDLPSLDHDSHINAIHLNVELDQQNESPKFIAKVPKQINLLMGGLYVRTLGQNLLSIWRKVTQAWKTIRNHTLDRAYLLEVGGMVVKRIFQIVREKINSNTVMTEDEMCAFAYKATRDMVYGTLAIEHMEDYDADEHKAVGDAVRLIPVYERICRDANPQYGYAEVKEHVYACLDWAYRMLNPETLRKIKDHYDAYSSIPNPHQLAQCG